MPSIAGDAWKYLQATKSVLMMSASRMQNNAKPEPTQARKDKLPAFQNQRAKKTKSNTMKIRAKEAGDARNRLPAFVCRWAARTQSVSVCRIKVTYTGESGRKSSLS